MAFHTVRHRPPEIELTGAREVWIATDLTDAFSTRIAERLAFLLHDLAPARVVALGRPPEAGAVVLSLALRRSISHEPALVEPPGWDCEPSCYTRPTTRIVELPIVTVLARLSAHDADGRLLLPSRVLERSEPGDEIAAEVRLVVRISREIDALFRSFDQELSLEVLAVDDAETRASIERAARAPSETTCAAIEAETSRLPQPGERARALHAAGQCRRALAAEGEDEAGQLARAEALFTAAMRLAPGEVYARALDETRQWLALFRSALLPVPEPPPAYRLLGPRGGPGQQ